MNGSARAVPNAASEPFLVRAGIELNRAERYRIFVSLTLLDFGFARELLGEAESSALMAQIGERIRETVRACDYVSLTKNHCFCLLFPETSRQGAEVAARRIGEMIRSEVARRTDKPVEHVIPLELASYPDAAGAKTVHQFLEELQDFMKN